jgi:hypothetical protein
MREIIRTEFKEVRRPLEGEWKTCATCSKLSLEETKIKSSPELIEWKRKKELHTQRAVAERSRMVEKEIDAKLNPQNTVMVLFDYTKAVLLPHFRYPNNPVKLWLLSLFLFNLCSQVGSTTKLPIQIAGLMNISTNGSRLFFHLPAWPKSSNLVITQIFLELLAVKTSESASQRARKLVLQSDGGSENVSRTMMGFCAYLIHMGWFDEIRFSSPRSFSRK